MPNGSKVNWQSLHEELQKQSGERHEMELRLINAFGDGLAGLRKDMADERAVCAERFKCIETDVVGLKVADRKWAGLTGLFAAGLASLAGWFGQR
jgi:hypothetical protein